MKSRIATSLLLLLFVVPVFAQAQSIFTTQTPQVQAESDGAAGEYGIVFTASVAGQVTGVRFWKSTSDTGTHTGRLWRVSDRALLATVTFSGGTASGWQSQLFAAPVSITAGIQYLATVSTPLYYGYTNRGLASVITNGNLSTVVGANGLWTSSVGTYPTASYQNSNYFRDVMFVAGSPVPAINVTPNVVTMNFNASQQFSAALTGGAVGPVSWSATCGSITSAGLYTAPASGTSCNVTGSLTGASDTSSVTLTSAATPTINVTPNAVTLNFSQQQQFSAALGGGAVGPVNWSASCGSVNSSGLYTAPSSGSSCSVTGTITGASDVSTVTLNQPPPPPATTTLYYHDFHDPEWYVVNRTSDTTTGETACYRPSQVSMTNGLVITAINQPNICSSGISPSQQWPYTSGQVIWNSRSFLYGTLEFRAKFPTGQGTWTSLWLHGSVCQEYFKNFDGSCNWPTPPADEIDVAEVMSINPGTVNQQIHSGSHSDGCRPTVSVGQYHTYQFIWQPGSMIWKIDGNVTCTVTGSYVPSNPMFVMLNLALGGIGGGTVNASQLPQTFTVDYIKITQ